MVKNENMYVYMNYISNTPKETYPKSEEKRDY